MKLAITIGGALLLVTAWSHSGYPVNDYGVIALLLGGLAIGALWEFSGDRHLRTEKRERLPGELPRWAAFVIPGGMATTALLGTDILVGEYQSTAGLLAGLGALIAFFVLYGFWLSWRLR